MADIEIVNEAQQGEQWSYQVRVSAGSTKHDYRVTLSRSDYDRWSEGQAEPREVVRTAFEFLLDNEPPSAIMASFDCSIIRRYFPHVDRDLPERLQK